MPARQTGKDWHKKREVSCMDIRKELEEKTQEMEALLKQYLPKVEGYQKTVLEAMNYSVLAGLF